MFTFTKQSNRLRALRSLHSAVCPACGRRKAERTAICHPCQEKLPEGLLLRVMAWPLLSDEWNGGMLEIMDTLEVSRFINPEPYERCQLFAVSVTSVTKGHLRKSLYSMTCPACGSRKPKKKRLCGPCGGLLKQAYRDVHNLSGDELDVDYAMFLDTMRPPGCNTDPRYLENFRHVLELLGAEVLHVPV